MLFVSPEIIATAAEEKGSRREKAKRSLAAVRAAFNSPEEIDDGPDTTPSKRIVSKVPGYRKPLHGPLITQRIGLGAIRAECGHFRKWLDWLESLG